MRCVAALEERGLLLASTCKRRFVMGPDGKQRITRTVLGTREHQDLLKKYRTAGVFIVLMTVDGTSHPVDFLLAQERRLYLQPAPAKIKREKKAKKCIRQILL